MPRLSETISRTFKTISRSAPSRQRAMNSSSDIGGNSRSKRTFKRQHAKRYAATISSIVQKQIMFTSLIHQIADLCYNIQEISTQGAFTMFERMSLEKRIS